MVGLSPSLLFLKNLEADSETLAEDSLKILPDGGRGEGVRPEAKPGEKAQGWSRVQLGGEPWEGGLSSSEWKWEGRKKKNQEKQYGKGLTRPCSSCMTLSKSFNLAVAQLLHL